MSFLKRKSQRGFTLIELLVTITIFAILTGVVLFNQGKFNSTILLTNLAYDTALTIRQAQTYGINIKEFNRQDVDTDRFLPYGVHFETGANNKSFILFADLDKDGVYIWRQDSSYDPDVDPSICQVNEGCVNRYSIKRGNYISKFHAVIYGSPTNSDFDFEGKLDIVFQRPNPEAKIHLNGNLNLSLDEVIITLTSADGGSNRYVKVQANGLIEILNP